MRLALEQLLKDAHRHMLAIVPPPAAAAAGAPTAAKATHFNMAERSRQLGNGLTAKATCSYSSGP